MAGYQSCISETHSAGSKTCIIPQFPFINKISFISLNSIVIVAPFLFCCYSNQNFWFAEKNCYYPCDPVLLVCHGHFSSLQDHLFPNGPTAYPFPLELVIICAEVAVFVATHVC